LAHDHFDTSGEVEVPSQATCSMNRLNRALDIVAYVVYTYFADARSQNGQPARDCIGPQRIVYGHNYAHGLCR
jgi:hypothetical protein